MLTLDHFTGLPDPRFSVCFEGELIYQLELETAEASTGASVGGREPFSLSFLGQADLFLEQGTYQLANPILGAHDIFVVPIGRREDDHRFVYQACFT